MVLFLFLQACLRWFCSLLFASEVMWVVRHRMLAWKGGFLEMISVWRSGIARGTKECGVDSLFAFGFLCVKRKSCVFSVD